MRTLRPGLFLPFLLLLPASVPGQERLEKDRITLRNGNRLEGDILSEGLKRIRIQLRPGEVIEVPMTMIASYARVGGRSEREEKASPFPLKARNEWFRLRDGSGNIVGCLNLVARPEGEDRFRFEEQWSFLEGDKRTLVSRIEIIDPKLQPVSCSFREACFSRDGKNVRSERLVRGEIRDERIHLEQSGLEGRKTWSMSFARGIQLPLVILEMLRQGKATGARTFVSTLYDPMNDVFELRRFDLAEGLSLPERLLPGPGGVRFLQCETDGRMLREWIAEDGRVLLREVNGVDLVAEPITAGEAEGLRLPDRAEPRKGSSSYLLLGGFELRLPRATWAIRRKGADRVDLLPPYEGAMVELRHRKGSTSRGDLPAMAGRVLHPWKLEHPWFEAKVEKIRRIQGRTWVQIEGGGKGEDGKLRLGRLLVTISGKEWFLLAASAGAGDWEVLLQELEDLCGTLRPRASPAVGRD